MKQLSLPNEWSEKIMPGGLPIPSVTIISGEGGSGKPLIETAFIAQWLRNGGKAIGIPLQYPSADFLNSSMKKLHQIDLNDYKDQLVYVQFNPDIDEMEYIAGSGITANLLKGEVWDMTIRKGLEILNSPAEEVLLFGSALNLLLFSPKYKDEIIGKLSDLFGRYRKTMSIMFSVSTSAMREEIRTWEDGADNLMFTEMDKEKNLYIYTERFKGEPFRTEKIYVPIAKSTLMELKDIAEHSRSKIIPKLVKIV